MVREILLEKRMEFIGQGQYGLTYTVCKGDDCNYVIKIQDNNENFKREVNALYDLNGGNIAQ